MLSTLPMITLVPAACAIPQIIERLELFKPIEVNQPLLLETDEEFEEFSEGESLPTELAVEGVEGVEAVSTKTYPCIINVNNALYDYTPLRVAATSLTGGWVNATDVAPPASTKIWLFAWCQALSETVAPACSGDVFAMTDSVAGGVLANTCAAVSGGAYADFVGVDLPLQTVSFFDPANGVTADLSGAQLQYLNGPACASNPLKKTQFNINIFCDPNTLFDYNPIANVTDPCAPSVQVISKVGCPLISPDIIMEWLAGVEKFFGIFFIGGGIFLCFFGFQLIGPTVCIIGLLTGVIVTMLIWYTFFFSADINTKQIWIFLGIGVVVGVALGLLLMKYPKIGAGMAAGYGGAVGGIMVNTILLSSFGWSWTMYACAVIAGGIAVWLSWKFYDPAIIGATGLIGAYALVRGISMYAGGWVSEKDLADLISSGQFDQIPTVYFGYLAGFVIVGTCGILFQRKRLARKQAREKVRRLRIN